MNNFIVDKNKLTMMLSKISEFIKLNKESFEKSDYDRAKLYDDGLLGVIFDDSDIIDEHLGKNIL